MSINNIQQNLLWAIDLIAINQASAVNFDTTEIATVLSKLENGNYWVSNGKVKYEAKSTETISYTENTQVYVSVSQGDYSQDKVIIGRYDNRKEEEKAYLYKDPYQRLGVSHIVVMEANEQIIDFNLTALGQPTLLGIETSVNVNTKPKDGVGYYGLQINLLNNNNETLMSFIIDSRNFIGNPYNMVSAIKHKNIFTLPSDFNISDIEKIKVEDYGDVEYESWSSITLRFGYDLESETIVNSESKAFIGTDNGLNTYGDGDNDSYKEVLVTRCKTVPKGENEIFYSKNLQFISEFDNELNAKNVITIRDKTNSAYLSFLGINLERQLYKIKFKYFIKTNSELSLSKNSYGLFKFGTGQLSYDNTQAKVILDENGEVKEIDFDEGSTYSQVVFNTDPGKWHEVTCEKTRSANNLSRSLVCDINISPNADIYFKDIELYELQPIPLNNLCFSWVKDGQVYSPNNPAEDLETSVSWYKYAPNKIDENLGVGWEKINSEDAWTLGVRDNYLDSTIPEERFRARLVYNDVDYLSNVLVLKNKDYVGETAAAVSPTMTLRLNDDGIYLYDHTAQLYETEKTLKTISASSNAGFEDDYRDLYWLIPKNSTMIAAPRLIEKKNGEETEYWYWDYLPDMHFFTEPTDFTLSVSYLKDYDLDTNNYYIIGGNGIKLEQNIYIKRSYQPNYLNNTIQCKAFFGDTSTPNEEGSIDLKFVSANNSGVEASLGIELVSDKGYFGGDNDKDINLEGIVYDKNGIPFEEQPKIFFNDLNCYGFSELSTGWTETWEKNTLKISHDKRNIGAAYFHFKINLQTISERLDERDSILGPIQSITDYIVTLPNKITDKDYVLTLRGDSPRDIAPQTFINYNVKEVENDLSSDFKNWGKEIILRYYPKNYNNYDNIWPSTERKDDNEDNIIEYKIYYDVETKICHIPYGSLLWFSIDTNTSTNEEEINNFNLTMVKAISEENNNFIINKEQINAPLTIKAYCEWNSETTNQAIQLSSYYTIPYFPTENVYHLDGATQISYSSFGDSPKPSRNIDYTLYNWNGKTQGAIASNNYYLEISEQDCPVKVENKWIEKEQAFRHRIIMPTLAPAEESIYTINVYNASSIKKDDEQILNKGTTLLAQYSLILLRNTYAFKEINAWGGSTITTEDYVISPMIGAGSKNSQNQFTGVIMGTSSEFPATGLYGFKNGVATFGFKEDGSCFMGSGDKARLDFNINDGLNLYAGDFNIYANKISEGKQNLVMSIDSENGLVLNGNLDVSNKILFYDRLNTNGDWNNNITHEGTFKMIMGKSNKGQLIFTLNNPGSNNQSLDKRRTSTVVMGYQEKITDADWPLHTDLFEIKTQSQGNTKHSLRLGVYDGDQSALSFICSTAAQSNRYFIENSKILNGSDNGNTSFIVLHPTKIYIGTKNGYYGSLGGFTALHTGIYITQDEVQIWQNGVRVDPWN